jgi:hypothetical protein
VSATNPTIPVTGQPILTDHEVALIPTANTSILYKTSPSNTVYVTYAFTEAENAEDAPTLTNGQLGAAQFHSESDLYEIGDKAELIPKTLFGSVAAYYQQRALAPQSQTLNGVTVNNIIPTIRVNGVETSLQYQPTRRLSIYANATYITSHYVDYIIFSNKSPGPNVSVGTATASGVVGTVFQDQGNAAFQQPGPKNYRESLVPVYTANVGATYTFDSGLGAGLNYGLTGPWNYFLTSNVVVPSQYDLDLTLFYAPRKSRWEFRATITNLTNQWGFQPNGAENVNDFIDPLPPIGLRGSITYRF